MSILGAFIVNKAFVASGSDLTPCLSTIVPRYFIESVNVVCQRWCRYHYVIHLAHHEIPYFFVMLVKAWAISHSNVAVAFHKPKGILFIWFRPNSHAKLIFYLCFFHRGICQMAEPRSSVVKNLASPNFEGLSSICGNGHASFMVTAFGLFSVLFSQESLPEGRTHRCSVMKKMVSTSFERLSSMRGKNNCFLWSPQLSSESCNRV